MRGIEAGRRPPEETLLSSPETTLQQGFFDRQADEIERLQKKFQFSETTPEQVEQRVEAARELIKALEDLPSLEQKEGRELSENAQISLENFILEEIVEHGADPTELAEQTRSLEAHTRDTFHVCINVNSDTLFKIVDGDGLIKTYEELNLSRRSGRKASGAQSRYRER